MKTATVIGAAIAGPAAAIRLARMGYDVTVYDRRGSTELYSAGILGITHSNWAYLEGMHVPVNRHELDNGFTDYDTGRTTVSPYRYITWYGLHDALSDTARRAGARYAYRRNIADPASMPGLIVEATGVAGAARRNLPHRYSGFTIFRGLSPLTLGVAFLTYRGCKGAYLTIGDTPDGAFWAYFVKRGEPRQLTTQSVNQPPPEYRNLPGEFWQYFETTSQIAMSPLSDWQVPSRMRDSERYLRIGDVNGPVRPVTTSGANLAIMDGFAVNKLLNGDRASERDLLRRRAIDLELGIELEGPEIGGIAEDVMFAQHHQMLFGGGYE
jgi:2-polyprenyl-6-methoxyphenol hydroxylase-like FAD-dependent oxidoreductase